MSVTATKEEREYGMTTASSTQGFVNDPVVSISGQIALARPDDVVCGDQPSSDDVRPWNLRRMGPLMTSDGRWSSVSYDHEQQIAVTETGQPVLDQRCRTAGPVAGPPTAPTTPPVDGEDPPSSEDWINDFAPEEPSPV